jgi:cell wall-associated NlpC family hydrolase
MPRLPQDQQNAVIDMSDSAKGMCQRGDASLTIGAHLVTRRFGYTHHGIYVGDGKVLHYAGWSRSLRRAPVQEASLREFADGHEIRVERTPDTRYSRDEVVRRAYLRLGEDCYRVTTNNCEHFCAWCLCGESRSDQIDALIALPHRCLQTLVNKLTQFVRAKPIRVSTDRPAYWRSHPLRVYTK